MALCHSACSLLLLPRTELMSNVASTASSAAIRTAHIYVVPWRISHNNMRTQSLCLSAVLNLSMKIYWICASCDASGTDYYIWRDKIIFSFSEAIAAFLTASYPHTEYNVIKSHQRKGLRVCGRNARTSHTHGNDNLFCIQNSFDWKYFFFFYDFSLLLRRVFFSIRFAYSLSVFDDLLFCLTHFCDKRNREQVSGGQMNCERANGRGGRKSGNEKCIYCNWILGRRRSSKNEK